MAKINSYPVEEPTPDDLLIGTNSSDGTTINVEVGALLALAASGGTTAARPALPLLYQSYFDTSLGMPVWWSGADWVDATGGIV